MIGVKFTQTYLCVPAINFHSAGVLCHRVPNGQDMGRGLQQKLRALFAPLHSPVLHSSEEQWVKQVFPLIEAPGRPAARGGIWAHLVAEELEAGTLALGMPRCYQICVPFRALQEKCRALQLSGWR